MSEEAREQAIETGDYVHRSFYVIGKAALDRFTAEYEITLYTISSPLKGGDETTELLPAIRSSLYYDGRDEIHGGVGERYTTPFYVVRIDGEYLYPFFAGGKTAEFSFLLDDLRYHDILYGYEKTHPKPTRVGTVTEKKMRPWLTWLHERRKTALDILDRRNSEVRTFLDRVHQIAPSCKEFRENDTSGVLVKNNIRLEWAIHGESSLDVRLSIDRLYHADYITTFEKMASGTF